MPENLNARWFRLNTTWSQSEWLAELDPAARLCWVELLGYVKAHGFNGKARSVAPVVFGRGVGIPAASVRELLDAAQADDALQVEDGDWVITGWAAHQGDPTARKRMRQYRERQNEPPETVTAVTRNDRNVTPTSTSTKTKTETNTPPTPSKPEPRKRSKAKADPAGFDEFWARYPKRSGGNPKARAVKAYRARIKAGTDPTAILEGVRRYYRFCEITGKLGTEYVMQAATFVGPDERWTEAWTPPPDTKPKPGSQAAEIEARGEAASYEDRPRPTIASQPSRPGDDPEAERRREQADNDRALRWIKDNPEASDAMLADIRDEMGDTYRGLAGAGRVVEEARLRARVLDEVLRPKPMEKVG